MAIIRYDPFANMSSLLRWPSLLDTDFSGSSQNLDVFENDKEVVVRANVAGMDPKNVDVTFHKGVLTITAEMEAEKDDKNKKFYQKSYSNYYYKVAVPGEIDPNAQPEASFKNGMLEVSFAKIPEEQPKKITVKA